MAKLVLILSVILGLSIVSAIESSPYNGVSRIEIPTVSFEDKPADTPADKPADTPADKPAEKPDEKPADKPADKPGDKKPEKGLGDYIKDLAGGLNAVSATWGGIVNAFKTTKSEKVEKIIKGEGFDHFAGSGAMNQITGLVEDVFDEYLAQLLTTLEVPKGRQKSFTNAMRFVKFSDSNTWNAYDMAFDKGDGGNCKFVSLLFNHDTANKKYNIFVADIKAQFDLAPDLAVIAHSKSIAGGIYSADTLEYKEIPASITENDIKNVLSFFKIVSFKNFADMIGLKLDFPEIPNPDIKPPASKPEEKPSKGNSTFIDNLFSQRMYLRKYSIPSE